MEKTLQMEFVLEVTVPIEGQVPKTEFKDLHQAMNFFSDLRNKEKLHESKVMLDRLRALFKYAENFDTTLASLKKEKHRLKVSFSFNTLEEMIRFSEEKDVIESNVMQ